MADFKKAKQKMDHILVNWFTVDPLMLNVWCMFDKKPDPKQETIGLDTRHHPPIMKYNPNFVNSLHKEHLEAVMASEGLKLMLRHPTTRLTEPKHISSLSSTITVNQAVMQQILNSDIGEIVPMPETFDMPKNSFFEEYFRHLVDKQQDVEEKIKDIWNNMSDEDKKEMIENAIEKAQQQSQQSQQQNDNQDGQQQNNNQDGQQQNDNQDGQQQNDNQDGQGYKEFNGNNDAMKEYFNPHGTANKDWSDNSLIDAEIQNMVNEKRSTMEGWGSFTGNYRSEIISANEPKISWKDIVRLFKQSVLTGETISSRMKLNRRYDLAQPGYRRRYTAKIIFAVDISGSMTDEDLAEGFAVINKICKHADISYVLFDTEIKTIEKKMKKAKESFVLTGRGGTDFQCVVDYAESVKADGLVIYTDGWADAPSKPKNMQTLWLLQDKNGKPPVEWGRVAHLDRYESH